MASHTHGFGGNITSGGGAHGTSDYSGNTNCGAVNATPHPHEILGANESPGHTHTITAYTVGNSALGSPNWWVHTHTVTGTSGVASSHTHAKGANSFGSGCDKEVAGYLCLDYPHTHPQGGSANSNAEASHTHTINGVTGNADPAGTPENHRHPITFTLTGGSHTHTVVSAWVCSANVCYFARSHTHTGVTTVSCFSHSHSLSGNTDYGGEAALVIRVGLHPSKPLAIILCE